MFCIQRTIEAQFLQTTYYENVLDPKPLVLPPVPPCEDKFFIKVPCYDFLYSGNSSSIVNQIVARIMGNNPGHPIPRSKVLSFSTEAEVDEWLLTNPMRCPGALHFVEKTSIITSYGIQTNSTVVPKRGKYEDPTFEFQIPLQVAAEREIARFLIGDPNFDWRVGLKEFARPPADPFSAIATIGPTCFFAIAMFDFAFQMSSLVMEKELKLRHEGLLVVVSSVFIVLFGLMFQFDFFLHSSVSILFLVFFLFQLNMTAFAFALSAFISQSSSSTNIGFYNFIVGLITQVVMQFGFPYSEKFSRTYKVIWSLFPPNLLAKALQMLTNATTTHQDPRMRWKGWTRCAPNDDECVLTMNDIFVWFVGTFFMWYALAIYFDNIVPNPSGVRKSVFYFLNPRYWTGESANKVQKGGICTCFSSSPQLEHMTPDDEDVLEEENTVKCQVDEGLIDPNVAVEILGLAKVYRGSTNISCRKCKRTPPYHALRLFCLLGPNGASKTTAINSLTGLTPVTRGDEFHQKLCRHDKHPKNNRCLSTGIVDVLTGGEHLCLFASIKGLLSVTIAMACSICQYTFNQFIAFFDMDTLMHYN
ncbi:hypothetical protein Cgig2_032268 [Carnegiea gigantea]|uniref:ABC transporter domain-containing protein n=1 Tax=Carnegiea gigantea TaxID=171969 RepID=A0A9Q1JPM3_9CARY|nr:hypothetical protein Cgig2_032268 [Carnegiea gigantea]